MANTLGTLSAPIIALECLQFLKKKFPILTQVSTDFSKDAVKFNQQVVTRFVTPQAAADFDPVNGYVAGNAVTTDAPVTINKHKHVSLSFSDQELSGTARNLVEEQTEAAAYSLGRQISLDLWSLVTTANFGAVTPVNIANAGAATRNTVLALRQALVSAGATINRQGVTTPDVYTAISSDVNIYAKLYSDIPPDFHAGAIMGLGGFDKITEFAELPIGGATPFVKGFFFGKEALLLATRVPADPGMFVTGVPVPALIDVVEDPDTGLSIQYRYYYDPIKGKLQMTLTLMYGVAVGFSSHAVVLTTTA